MSSSNSNVEILTQDWVQKIHFENKVDLNLQIPSKDDSIKIEVDEIPIDYLPKIGSTTNEYKNDSYLQSILSSSPSPNTLSACTGNRACTCYKCQRQRRRAGMNRGGANNNDKSNRAAEETFSSSFSSPPPPRSISPVVLPVDSPTAMSTTVVAPLTPAQSPQPQKAKRSNTLRKTPTLKSYERHMPKPTYSQKDSIYRIDDDDNYRKRQEEGTDKNMRPNNGEDLQKQDDYRMAWKEDGTGDDLLSSLVTFQTIFEEKGNENEGLSDLLEQRAQELKYQKLREQAEALNPKKSEEDVVPPRRSDCLTLSYRNGAKHNPLTLYHTMKMTGEQQRMSAYNVAFNHCINANSGLRSWMKRARVAPTRENSKLVQPARRATTKRSLLHPLSSRKNKTAGDELLIWSSSSEHLSHTKRSIDMISSPIPIQHSPTPGGVVNHSQLTDVLSAAQALLPNQNLFHQQQGFKQNKVPYDHIDTPSKPGQPSPAPSSPTSTSDMKDTSSTSSAESVTGRTTISSNTSSKLMKSRPGRLFSSLSRKTSLRSHSSISNKASSIKSLEKIDSIEESPSHEKVLDDLCRILPHIDRAELSPYVHEANNDYMTALQLCKAAVINGKLS